MVTFKDDYKNEFTNRDLEIAVSRKIRVECKFDVMAFFEVSQAIANGWSFAKIVNFYANRLKGGAA